MLQTFIVMREPILAAAPLFLFMGYILEQAGLMERLFSGFRLLLSRVKGSLYIAVLTTATLFATATGIVGASVTILGVMAAPIMRKSGYDSRLSAGTIAAGGTLGMLIPPSLMLVVHGTGAPGSHHRIVCCRHVPRHHVGQYLHGLHRGPLLPEPAARTVGCRWRNGPARSTRSFENSSSASSHSPSSSLPSWEAFWADWRRRRTRPPWAPPAPWC